ncbi:hypothetical protein HCN44_011256 [Aphidius gifuensis]|uniref:Activator of basal transcription 1 n=1 Tax=Aphidius gifuensis TaxID=684658 RepID=A0A834XWR2_APHGI|nr:activator of basal transcription 1-like [Aphidius gifuensis]KAF7993987.1 hypothetical protein HCN44_011256 [Aphidius gifuensis]
MSDDSEMEVNNETTNVEDEKEKKTSKNHLLVNEKRKKRGIVYLSSIPRFMNVTKVREIFSEYGKIDRVYLQLAPTEIEQKGEKKIKKKKKVASKHFTEGWVEFESKKIAKHVAATLNNTQISSRKKSKFYDVMWNIKYLPRFKWLHLTERLSYERAVRKQRISAEIAQVKREVNFFAQNIDSSKKILAKQQQKGIDANFIAPEIKQRDTDDNIRKKKKQINKEDTPSEFLSSLF